MKPKAVKPLRIALPKGRLGETVLAVFEKAGCGCPDMLSPGRRLLFENVQQNIVFYWVKPSDAAVYVERGAADVGVVGSDVLFETKPDVYELTDLRLGICRMAVAAPRGFHLDAGRRLKVASKYPATARSFFEGQGRDIDLIKLNGSVELAPLLGLSDVIVDIVETGRTLKENGLDIVQEIMPVSARLIANRAAYPFRRDAIEGLTAAIRNAMEEER